MDQVQIRVEKIQWFMLHETVKSTMRRVLWDMIPMFSNAIIYVFNFIVGKAFAIATAVVFGGAAMVISTVASKLELHNVSDLTPLTPNHVQ